MTTKKFTLFAIVIAACILIVGCKKEKTEKTISSTSEACVGTLHFNSSKEFRETQEKVLAMNEAERREWERQQGFKSYATKCEELFEELEAKGINSDEDIYNFVKENSDYFFIREEEGEKYLTSYLEFSSYYQFVDENRMLQIGNNVIKVFDEGVINAPIDKEEDLLNVTSFYEPAKEGFNYFETPKSEFYTEYKDDDEDGCNCNHIETVARKTNGNNRTYVRFYINPVSIIDDNPLVTAYYQEMEYYYNDYKMKIRPYHRIMFVWYWCRRTISYNVSYTVYDTPL